MNSRHKAFYVAFSIVTSISLAACGGGSSVAESLQSPPPPPTGQTGNQPPVANISGPQQALTGETVNLDGSGSTDSDGDSISFDWTQTQGPAISLAGNTNSEISFVAPSITAQPAMLTIQLTVQDGNLSNTTSIDIVVMPLSDTMAPSIVMRAPAPQDRDVSISTTVQVTFDEPLDESILDQQSLTLYEQGAPVPGNFVYDAAGFQLSFTPSSPLATNTAFDITVSSTIQDLSGNPFAGETWTFTTGGQFNLGGTSQATINQCMDDGDKRMLTLVNDARSVSRSCGSTQMGPTATLVWNCLLDQSSVGHSTSMANNDFHEHVSPVDGSDPGDRIIATGYDPQAWGENIAAGYFSEDAVMTGWLNSPGHCSNIMSAAFTEMGAGFAENPTSTYRIYWTQNFGRPRN